MARDEALSCLAVDVTVVLVVMTESKVLAVGGVNEQSRVGI